MPLPVSDGGAECGRGAGRLAPNCSGVLNDSAAEPSREPNTRSTNSLPVAEVVTLAGSIGLLLARLISTVNEDLARWRVVCILETC